MDDLKLKPCPFCGEEAILVKDFSSFKNWAYVKCQECGASTRVGSGTYVAIDLWNKRVEEKR